MAGGGEAAAVWASAIFCDRSDGSRRCLEAFLRSPRCAASSQRGIRIEITSGVVITPVRCGVRELAIVSERARRQTRKVLLRLALESSLCALCGVLSLLSRAPLWHSA